MQLRALWRWPLWVISLGAAVVWLRVAVGATGGWPDLAVAGSVGITFVLAVGQLSLRGFVPVVTHGSRARGQVALTFDDGPDPVSTSTVLDMLASAGARATFFVLADKAARYPELVRRMRAQGHEVASHGCDHLWHSMVTPGCARRTVADSLRIIGEIAGETPRYFRPPYGVTTPALAVALGEQGTRVVGWSLRAFDTVGARSELRAQKLADRVQRGDIILLHDASQREGRRAPLGPQMLPILLHRLTQRGLCSVTVRELLAESDISKINHRFTATNS